MSNKILKNGYIRSFSVHDVPVHIHWTFPVGGIFITFFLGNPTIDRSLPLIVAYTFLIVIHEFGHALAAKMSSSKVHAILVTGLGGWCVAQEPVSFGDRFLFYAGGVIAQLILLIVTVVSVAIFGDSESSIVGSFVFVFTLVNGMFILLNLLPTGESDGMRLFNLVKDRINNK